MTNLAWCTYRTLHSVKLALSTTAKSEHSPKTAARNSADCGKHTTFCDHCVVVYIASSNVRASLLADRL